MSNVKKYAKNIAYSCIAWLVVGVILYVAAGWMMWTKYPAAELEVDLLAFGRGLILMGVLVGTYVTIDEIDEEEYAKQDHSKDII